MRAVSQAIASEQSVPTLAAVINVIETRPRNGDWIHLFFDVPSDLAFRLEAAACARSFERGETLFSPDEPADSLFMIVSGRVKLLLTANVREDLLLRILEEGDYCGELTLLGPRRSPLLAVALEPTETFVLSREALREGLGDSPELATQLLAGASEQLLAAYDMVLDTLELDTAGRLAKKLLALARDHGWSDPDRSVIDIGLTQHDLARMLGVSRESVNKQLAWFRARGIIQVERGRIVICRPGDLRRRIC